MGEVSAGQITRARELVAELDNGQAALNWALNLQSCLAGYVPRLLDEIERQRIAIHGCACPAPYDQCTHDEPLLSTMRRQERKIDRLERELAEARRSEAG